MSCKKSTGRDKQDKKHFKNLRHLMLCSLFCFISIVLPKWISSNIYIYTTSLIIFGEGRKAIKKLKEFSKEKLSVTKKWLSLQAIWQVHLPSLNRVNRPNYEVKIPNEMHQFDLLYMSSDMLYRNSTSAFPLESMLLPDTKWLDF